MTGRPPLTEIAQEAWQAYLRPGSWAVDATAGNGLDTGFLARAVGAGGRVFAVDIQQAALAGTARRLEAAGLLDRATLIHGDHARLGDLLPCAVRGRIDLVCFNLGYLPGGDHAVTTTPASTLPALLAALLLLGPGGALSVIAYRGHPGAGEEAESVERFFSTLPAPWQCVAHVASGSEAHPGPVWWLAGTRKPAAAPAKLGDRGWTRDSLYDETLPGQ